MSQLCNPHSGGRGLDGSASAAPSGPILPRGSQSDIDIIDTGVHVDDTGVIVIGNRAAVFNATADFCTAFANMTNHLNLRLSYKS